MWQLQIEPGSCSWAWKLVQLEFNQSPCCHSKSFGYDVVRMNASILPQKTSLRVGRHAAKSYKRIGFKFIEQCWLHTYKSLADSLWSSARRIHWFGWAGTWHGFAVSRLLNFCYQLPRLFICIHACADAQQVTIEYMCIMTKTHKQMKLNVTVWKDR